MSTVTCLHCNEKATHIRFTQFSGDHPYCDEHGLLESDFQQNDSYAFWEESRSGFLFKDGRYVIIKTTQEK